MLRYFIKPLRCLFDHPESTTMCILFFYVVSFILSDLSESKGISSISALVVVMVY